ncbi:MAG: transglutaminase domain-containing protein [Eubacterium sp.]
MKKIISFVLSLVIIASSFSLPATVFAFESTTEYAIIYNPLTENKEDVYYEQATTLDSYDSEDESDEIIYDSPEEAAEILRDALVNREAEISLKYYYPKEFNDSNETGIPLFKKLFFMSLDEKISVSSVDGDYLRWHWGRYLAQSNNATLSNGKNCCATTYTMTYYTTLEEEQELTEKINAEIPSLNLDKKSDYLKIKTIHNYICESTNYDYVTLEDTTNKYKYTAYGILVQGYGVCQGYASLFTRLCKENGLPARTIVGNNHAWNIVKLGDKFYNVDTTWDDTMYDNPNESEGNYWSNKYSDYYLLRGATDFGGHTPINEYAEESFWEPYPLAETKYLCTHDVTYKDLPENASCQDGFSASVYCKNCELLLDTYTIEANSQHNYEDTIIEPNCSNNGYTLHKCIYCDYEYKDGFKAITDHKFAQATSEDGKTISVCEDCNCDENGKKFELHRQLPDCVEDGYYYYLVDDAVYKLAIIPALGHSFKNYTDDDNATCTENGTKTAKCERCDATDSVEIADSRLGHNYESVVTEPTCTQDGYTTYTCTRCSDTYTADVKGKLGHSFTNYVSDNNVTCTKDGTKTAKCDRCDVTDTITDPDAKARHTFIANVIEPTCTEDGHINYICAICNYTETEIYEGKLGHSFKNYTDDDNATCTENGTKTAKCERCDATDSVEIADSRLGHNYESVVTEPTCTQDGYTTYTCTRCKDTYTADVEGKLNHAYTQTVVEPTCTLGGYTVYTCTRCDDSYKDNFVNKLGHSFTNYESNNDATCLNDGTKTAKCDRCDVTKTVADSGSRLGHDYEDVVTEPSCTTQGYTKHICRRCDYWYKDSYVNRLGHDYEVKVVEPTCTQPGYTVHTCSRCDYCETDNSTPSLGHSFDEGVVAKAPTCISEGEMKYTCERCNAIKNETIAKAEHTHTKTVKKATVSKNGEIVDFCSECSKYFGSTEIPKASNIKISTTSYTYDGKTKTPSVTVKDSKGKALVKNKDYTVSYASGRKNVGKYAVKVTLKGNYTGTKTLYFTIKPKATSISSVSAKSKGFTVKWKKQSTQVTGYQIQYSTSSKFTSPKTVTVSSYKTTSKTISKLKSKKKYYVRVRTYKTVSGTKYYSSWSKAKSVTTKK